MSSVYVHPISPDSDQLHQYVEFGINLYKDNPCYVPPLIMDDVRTLTPESNPAFDFCEAQSFMAFRNGEPVGTITAIINHAYNEKTGKKQLRFGWLEFIDDREVVAELREFASTRWEPWLRSTTSRIILAIWSGWVLKRKWTGSNTG